jgi:endoglycosylceramidase
MRHHSTSSRALIVALILSACGSDDDHPRAAPTPTAVATHTELPSRTVTPSAIATASATATASPSSTATAPSSPSPTPTTDPLRLPDLHAEPHPVNGGRIVDAEGREVLLRGVNVNALAEYWQYGAFATTFPFTAADADLMAAIGWNAVRLLLSWSRVEPQPGAYDAAHLESARAAIRQLTSRGLYTIIDLHQDAWGATLAARPDEVCLPPAEPAIGWDGAPGWATLDGGAPRCASLGVRELNPAVSASFATFFANAPGPGGVGIRTRYVSMLAHVARTLAGEPGVAGYDLINEPNAFDDTQLAQLAALYGEAIAAIRAAEQAAGSPPRLVLFEPGAPWAVFGFGAPPDFPRDRDVVYAPHLYQGGLDDQPLAPAFDTAVSEARIYGGAPVLSGEWGSDPRRASDPDDPYFIAHQQLQDQFRISATLWTWRESCGDPHKAGDARAGRVPYVWGEFEVDCTTNAVGDQRHDLVDQLSRGYVRAAPGRLLESRWDHVSGSGPLEAGTLRARGVADAPGELLIFYPGQGVAGPAVSTSGLADVRHVPAPGGHFYLVAQALSGEWDVVITPGVP